MSQVQCPNCGMFKVTTVRVQTIDPPTRDTRTAEAQQESRWVIIILLLSLTVIGLPIAYWLCKYLEKEYPVSEPVVRQYSYKCNICAHQWIARSDEGLPSGIAPRALPRVGNTRAPRDIQTSVGQVSPLSQLVTWWIQV